MKENNASKKNIIRYFNVFLTKKKQKQKQKKKPSIWTK